MTFQYSVVIPLKNEESCIADLIQELEPVMQNLKQPWELICVDDGSTDRTREVLQELANRKPHYKIILFDKNYGQSSAFQAGFKAARGQYVITLDGDGQNDPADIPKLIAFADKYDLVCGVRVKRRDTWFKRIISKCANSIRNWLCGIELQDSGCSLKIYRRACLDQIKLYNGLHRHFPVLFNNEGFSLHQEPVNHRPRLKGVSKYNLFNRSFNTVADLLAVYWMKKRQLRYKIVNDTDSRHSSKT